MSSIFEIRERARRAEGAEVQTAAPPEFTDGSGRDYQAIYRAVMQYHRKYNPPRLTLEYWHEAVGSVQEVAASYNNDPLVNALLIAVIGELEREYKRIKTAQEQA